MATALFALDSQRNLRPDYTQDTAALLRVLVQQAHNSTFPTTDVPSSDFAPSPATVTVVALLYASLGTSLLAAFIAILGKQCLKRYQRRKGASAIERFQDRQRKTDGMKEWLFHIVTETLPLMLQAALLLFGCALSCYLWTINHAVAIVNIAFTSAGALVYLILVLFASFSYACPYQTPFSIAIHQLLDLDGENAKHVPRLKAWVQSRSQTISRRSERIRVRKYRKPPDAVSDMEMANIHTRPNSPSRDQSIPDPIFEGRDAELQDNSMNASCICWIIDNSTDPDAIRSAMRLIPEVNWNCVKMLSAQSIKGAFSSWSSADESMIPGTGERSRFSFKAALHLKYQTLPHTARNDITKHLAGIATYKDPFQCPPEDGELQNMLDMVQTGLQSGTIAGWLNDNYTSCSPSQFSWMCHLFLYEVWAGYDDRSIDSALVYTFIQTRLSTLPPSSEVEVVNCVLMLAVFQGMPLNIQDLSVKDKR